MARQESQIAARVRRWWAWPGELRRQGVLGINRRNADYVLRGNPRAHYPRVDDKLLTKSICEARRIPVPQTYLVIERHGDIARFAELINGWQQFVIKPAKGSAGRGIIVVAEQNGAEFVTSSGERLLLADVCYHLSTVLSGLYSLAGQPDRAIVEQRIVRHPVFESVAVGGTPDVRVVLHRYVPVMAMVRLPTWGSRGRANLHQGAVAAAIHLSTGETFGGVCQNRAVRVHPDTRAAIAGLEIPCWDGLLEAAMQLAEGLEMGYVGIDFVLDAALGPVVLEGNARPGLAIQVANRCGLTRRLALVDAEPEGLIPVARRRELAAAVADLR
jgi:alpha-L-glutamate ligase-like protein